MSLVYEKKLPKGAYQIYLTERPPFAFLEVNQVHGGELLLVEKADQGDSHHIVGTADGMVVLQEQFTQKPLGIKTADCLPVVVIGHKGVAAIHAGWRSVQQKILAHPSLQLLDPYYAFIGPAIRPCCYEVGSEFKTYFPSDCLEERTGKIYFDLAKAAITQLQEHYKLEVQLCPLCTMCSTAPRLNSHRRDNLRLRNYNIYDYNCDLRS
ncbi:MAG: polyphenol oxidase family protein [Oligoflexia bacterium]|nr:polyphenol oxidase family protein [Oligoflexia bacterium]MBF0365886.1 polyphenol oxidase family protein [Oligoflexia bacterium]